MAGFSQSLTNNIRKLLIDPNSFEVARITLCNLVSEGFDVFCILNDPETIRLIAEQGRKFSLPRNRFRYEHIFNISGNKFQCSTHKGGSEITELKATLQDGVKTVKYEFI